MLILTLVTCCWIFLSFTTMAEATEQFSAVTKIRDFPGQTPLQLMATKGETQPTALSSQERFPYYTAFPFAWYFVCYSDDLQPGQVQQARYLARDLVLWRGEDNLAHVMDAYCPHLGANIALGGRVEGNNLVCPYHWWEYDAQGHNVKVPYSDKTNRKAKLRSYPTIERNGFVLFWYHPDPSCEPLWEIPHFPEYFTDEWTEFHKADWKVRCPWQELAENGPDYIHLKTVHGAATVPELESLSYDGYNSSLRSKVDFDTPRGPTPGRIDTDSWGPGFAIARFSGIIDTIFMSATTPIDWEYTLSVKGYKIRKLGDTPELLGKTERVGQALVADLRKQMLEDNIIFDNKIQISSPALVPEDGPIMAFRRWAQQFYVAGDPMVTDRITAASKTAQQAG